MASTNTNTPSKFQVQITAMISGISLDLPSAVTNVTVDGNVMTKAQILAQLNAIETTLDTAQTAKVAYQEALATRKAAMPGDRTFYENLVMAVKQTLGASPAQLAAFGITPPKARAKATVKQAAIAKAKAEATRQLRGTKGKKQKQLVTLAGQATLQVLGPNGQPLLSSSTSSESTSSTTLPSAASTAAAVPTTVAPTTTGH